MMASIPFVVYGVFRYMLLVHRDGGGNPDTLLLADRPLQITLLLWLVVVGVAIYVHPAVERLKRNLVLALALGAAVYLTSPSSPTSDRLSAALGSFDFALIPVILGLVCLSYVGRFFRWLYYLKVLKVSVPWARTRRSSPPVSP